MEKKRKSSGYWINCFEPQYANIRLYATERYTGGWKNVYNARDHRQLAPIRDSAEAGAVLIVVQCMALENGRIVQYSADEQKRLDAIGSLEDQNLATYQMQRPRKKNGSTQSR